MFRTIMVPVDLAETESIDKALLVAADLGKHYGARLHYVGVTAPAADEVSHNPAEFADALKRFADDQASEHGVETASKAVTVDDPAVELDRALQTVGEEIGADLVVMASRQPGLAEHVFSSNAGYLASHSSLSVMVVR